MDKSIFICGATDSGSLYGVYGFLEECFGYRYYAPDEYAIDSVYNMDLPNMDITNRPDFDYRSDNYGEMIRNNDVKTMPIETHEELSNLNELWVRWDFTV